MKKVYLVIFICCLFSIACSQTSDYWQQKVDYSLDVTLNDSEHSLNGYEKIIYTNNSPDTLTFIWFHLWPNAYKNDRTAFSDQQLRNGDTKFYFSSNEDRGYINRLDFKVDGIGVKTEDHPEHIDIIKVLLPAPLLPKQQITITTPFHVKFPFNFSRSGHYKQTYQVTQWYPKPAVYDIKGWHPMPYLDQGEFYSEFGNFDVRITIPKDYVIAATGVLQDDEEKKWMRDRTSEIVKNRAGMKMNETVEKQARTKSNAGKERITKESKTQHFRQKPGSKPSELPLGDLSSNDFLLSNTKTIHFTQDSVHDFAWFAGKDFIVNTDTCRLLSGKIIEVYTYYTPKYEKAWQNSVQYCKDAVRFYSEEIGEYPYDVVSAVQGPPNSFAGGMEYPTITLISPIATDKLLDNILAHEIGHNWFYGILASNERNHPWMDEGVNSFYDKKYMQQKYGSQLSMEKLLFQTKAVQKTDQPIATSSEELTHLNYALSVYHKAASWLGLIENRLGNTRFKSIMQEYYEQWRFRHPQEEDFKNHFAKALGDEVDSVYNLLNQTGALYLPRRGWEIATPFAPGTYKKFIEKPSKHLLTIAPSLGFNSYDKVMVGGLISNYKLPPSPFQFVAAPMYATGSKQFTGIGRLSYSIYSDRSVRRTEFFISGATFSMDKEEDGNGQSFYKQFHKLTPGVQLRFKEKNPLSTVRKSIQWKTFLINEDGFRYGYDSVISFDTTIVQVINVTKESRYLNQLQLRYENMRELYPFDVLLNIEQAKDFIRPSLTANYFYNYPNDGGMQLRFFTGKFIYTGGKTNLKHFDTQRYHLQMTGPDGFEDYTYSNYFIGRNHFEGMASQQIMIRDGGFKVRTDLLSEEVGRTDNWLMAMNLSSSIPSKFNPLSVLRIPVRLFADIGTYAEAWEAGSEKDRFLFDAGVHLPMLNGNLNIYIPLVYSSVFKDYIQSTIDKNRFLKTISFNIDLNKLLLNKIKKEVDF